MRSDERGGCGCGVFVRKCDRLHSLAVAVAVAVAVPVAVGIVGKCDRMNRTARCGTGRVRVLWLWVRVMWLWLWGELSASAIG